MELADLLTGWRASATERVPDLDVFDAHTHVGSNDPDGFSQSFDDLLALLSASATGGCFVFPFHEPDGYPGPNDAVRSAALAFSAAHPGGPTMVPFCRVNPWAEPIAEAERSLDLGARGIKLHPRAEAFTLDHPAVRDLFALAQERGVPLLVHSGRGIEAPGGHLLSLATAFPGARVILAHAGATDLSWLWRAAADVPNLLFDTAWWMPADLLALFSLIPPAQILFASDAPYGNPLVSMILQLRLVQQVGWSEEQIRLMFAGQSRRLADGAPLAVAGPAIGERDRAPHLLLDRVAELLQMATYVWIRGGDGAEVLSLARLACNLPDEHDDAAVCAAVVDLLDVHDALFAADPDSWERFSLLMLAGCLARTPDVALPGR